MSKHIRDGEFVHTSAALALHQTNFFGLLEQGSVDVGHDFVIGADCVFDCPNETGHDIGALSCLQLSVLACVLDLVEFLKDHVIVMRFVC